MQKAKPKKEIIVEEKVGDVGMPGRATLGTKGLFPKSSQMTPAQDPTVREREARWAGIVDEAFELFIRKSRGYGNNAATLGSKGQFAELWRKVGKLKVQFWDRADADTEFESTEEVLKDLIGHSILFLDYLKAGNR